MLYSSGFISFEIEEKFPMSSLGKKRTIFSFNFKVCVSDPKGSPCSLVYFHRKLHFYFWSTSLPDSLMYDPERIKEVNGRKQGAGRSAGTVSLGVKGFFRLVKRRKIQQRGLSLTVSQPLHLTRPSPVLPDDVKLFFYIENSYCFPKDWKSEIKVITLLTPVITSLLCSHVRL